MARRRAKKSRRRSPKTISLYNMAVGYGNLAILTEGTMGTSPYGVITGSTDLGYKSVADAGLGVTSMTLSGAGVISLGDILNEPSLAMNTIMQNARSNAVPMAIGAITFNAGAKIFRKTMAKPFREANKLIKPLGLGVRL
jgi:hypothetical protein